MKDILPEALKCPKCGSRLLKKTSRNGYTYYGCDKFPACDFMTWDVPVKDDCPVCGQTMFKKAGRGFNKPFCANPACSNFLPEDKRGYRRRKPAEDGENAAEKTAEGAQPAETAAETPAKAAKPTRAAKTPKTTRPAAAKKPAAKKPDAKKTAAKTTAAKKTTKKAAEKTE